MAFRHGEAHIQERKIDRLGQVVVCTRLERLLQIFAISFRSHEQDEKCVAVRARTKFTAQVEPAFAGQHPIQDEEGIRFAL